MLTPIVQTVDEITQAEYGGITPKQEYDVQRLKLWLDSSCDILECKFFAQIMTTGENSHTHTDSWSARWNLGLCETKFHPTCFLALWNCFLLLVLPRFSALVRRDYFVVVIFAYNLIQPGCEDDVWVLCPSPCSQQLNQACYISF